MSKRFSIDSVLGVEETEAQDEQARRLRWRMASTIELKRVKESPGGSHCEWRLVEEHECGGLSGPSLIHYIILYHIAPRYTVLYCITRDYTRSCAILNYTAFLRFNKLR